MTSHSGVLLDSRGQVWLPVNDRECRVFGDDGFKTVKNTGFPRFEDAQGCMWFMDPGRKRLTVIDPGGLRGEMSDESFTSGALMVEHGGAFWITTTRGLLRVTKTRTKEGYALEPGPHYEKDVPKGGLQLFVDGEDNLWLFGPGPIKYRLWRMTLPR